MAKDCRELDRTPQPDFGKMDRNELKGTDVGLKNDGTYKATILLLGGTGKVARRIAPLLSADGYNVLLASRSGSSPASLPNTKGVEFDWLDTNSYDNPFITSKGDDDAKENLVDAVFMIAPPVLDALPLAKKFIDGVIKRGVRRIVFLSGSIQHCGDGPILSQISEYIKGKGRKYRDDGQIPNNPDPNAVEWTILRPSWFMENFSEMHHRYTIRDENRLVSATGRGKIPFVSAEDIANVAYKALIGWRSNTFEKGLVDMELVLKGAELWAYDDVALLLTELLGRKISHVHVREEVTIYNTTQHKTTKPSQSQKMPPRGFTNPAPKTESAREAVKSFYCELCSKGYARMNEYEAHLSSYDHSHKQRLKDMRQLTRDPMASSKARKAEAKANSQSGLISIKLGGEASSSTGTTAGGFKKGGFKKSGFKSAFAPVDGDGADAPVKDEIEEKIEVGRSLGVKEDGLESDTDDEQYGYEMYDPRYPTD